MQQLFFCLRYTMRQWSSDDEGERRTGRNVDRGPSPSTSNGKGKPTSSKSKPATSTSTSSSAARVPSSTKSPSPQHKATATPKPKPTPAPPQPPSLPLPPPPTKMDIALDINDDEDLLIIPDDVDLTSEMEEDIQEIQMNDLFPTIASVTSLAGNAEPFSELASPLENGGAL